MNWKTLSILAAFIAVQAQAKTLTIGVDLSGSNPMLTHPNYAAMAGQFAAEKILQLKDGDQLQVLTFGAREKPENILRHAYVISRKLRAKKLARYFGEFLSQLPEQTAQGQPSTNIVAWLEFTSGFDCGNGGTILAFTDGLESSSYVSPGDFASGKKALPEPDVSLKGCDLVFYGLGAGLDPTRVKNIRKSWRAYAEKAGATFSSIIP